jgi:hypothetical protein
MRLPAHRLGIFLPGRISHFSSRFRAPKRFGAGCKPAPAVLEEYKVYEHAIAVSDSLIGWLYGLAV